MTRTGHYIADVLPRVLIMLHIINEQEASAGDRMAQKIKTFHHLAPSFSWVSPNQTEIHIKP